METIRAYSSFIGVLSATLTVVLVEVGLSFVLPLPEVDESGNVDFEHLPESLLFGVLSAWLSGSFVGSFVGTSLAPATGV